ncbi:MAG TPA: hypothetical protein VLG50_05920 [Candidatus Saccharimonadales bacterium]|nr:hypothetical protein [Candidatus Saccharimonadales bacterium]
MTFYNIISDEWLIKNAGVIPDILCCLYKIDPRSVYRQLNKQIYQLTAPICYDYYKNKPISKNDIDHYIKLYHPSYYIYSTYYYYNSHTLCFNLKYRNRIYYTIYTILRLTLRLTHLKNGHYLMSFDGEDDYEYDNDNVKIWDIDHISFYHIRKNRTNLTYYDVHYAKNKFKNSVQKLSPSADDHLINMYIKLQWLLLYRHVFHVLPTYYPQKIKSMEFKCDKLKKKPFDFKQFSPIDVIDYEERKLNVMNDIQLLYDAVLPCLQNLII